jgi:hypothetical protein
MKLIALPLLAVALLAGCSAERTTPAAPASTVTVTAATPSTSVAAPTPPSVELPAAPVTVTVTTTPAPAPHSEPEAAGPCTDDDLAVTNGPLGSANTQRHVALSFTNTSVHACTLVGYPGADLVTPAGGVLINVPRRPANAAPRLTLKQLSCHSAQRIRLARNECRRTHLQRERQLCGLDQRLMAPRLSVRACSEGRRRVS